MGTTLYHLAGFKGLKISACLWHVELGCNQKDDGIQVDPEDDDDDDGIQVDLDDGCVDDLVVAAADHILMAIIQMPMKITNV